VTARRRQRSLARSVAADLRTALQDGTLGADGRLPAEPELARLLGVSRATIREAVAELEEQGLVRRRQGAGTFVQRNLAQVRNNLNLNSGMTEMIRAAGKSPGTLPARFAERDATSEEREKLELTAGSRVLGMSRVRTADGRPFAKVTVALPISLLEAHSATVSTAEEILRSHESTYEALESMGIVVHFGQTEILPELASAALARELGIRPRTMLVDLAQVDYEADDSPVLASHEHFVTDVVSLRVYRKGPA
jgi:GntR family transcriptional regulator